jgi:cbb3-type cytochrome oxidase subunit 3
MLPLAGSFGVMVLFALFTALVFWLSAKQTRGAAEQLRRLSERLHLQLQETPKIMGIWQDLPEVRGVRRNKHVRIYKFTTRAGKSSIEWAAVLAQPATPSNLVFKLTPQGLGTKLSALFGAKEIEVGDPEFDRRWFIETNAPDYFRAALLPELRGRLLAIMKAGGTGTYEMTGEGVRYCEKGSFRDRKRAERFVEIVEAVCDLVDVSEVYDRTVNHAQARG